MPGDSPGSPPRLILLDSPPASPMSFTIASIPDDSTPINRIAASAPLDSLGSTPSKRQRKRRTNDPGSRATNRKRSRKDRELQQETSDWTSEPDADSDVLDCILMSPESPRLAVQTAIPDLDDYERYAGLVLADCLPFYQLSPTVYVMQGWDGHNNQPTVRHSYATFFAR